jgi:signal transduction histidine kinase
VRAAGRRTASLRRLLLGLTLVGLLPLAAVSWLAVEMAQRAHAREVERATLDVARALASALDAELSATAWALQALATSNDLVEDRLPALHAELLRFMAARPDVLGMRLLDAQGRVVLRSGAPPGTPSSAPVEPGSLARVLRAGRPVVGELRPDPSGTLAFPVRVPVAQDGSVRWVLTAAMRPERIKAIVDRQRVPADWVIAVYDAGLQRVARSRDHAATLGKPPSDTLRALLQSIPAEGVGRARTLDGVENVTAVARLPDSGWTVVIGAPLELADAVSRPTLMAWVGGLGASLALALVLAWLLARRVTGEIGRVLDRAASIGEPGRGAAPAVRTRELAVLLAQVETAHARVRAALDEALRAAAAKDEFLAVLGHELRNPLAPITNVMAILDRTAGPHTERERRILRRQVRHITRLVDDLLDVARLVEGRLALHPEPLDLALLVREAVEGFREHAHEAPVLLELPAGPLEVVADPVRIAQVLQNLLANAVRHGAGRPVTVALDVHAGMARLRVSDQGEGIAPEQRGRLFEPFWQGRQGAGSLGLGLAIVRGIVERHRGRVRAESPGPGLGATFEVLLPLRTAPPGGAAAGA